MRYKKIVQKHASMQAVVIGYGSLGPMCLVRNGCGVIVMERPLNLASSARECISTAGHGQRHVELICC